MMQHSVLITQSLQRNFIERVEAHEPLPSALHVGHEESLRLMGRDPLVGPIAQILNWARLQPTEHLDIIHIRDWHEDNAGSSDEDSAVIDQHCIAGTPGAALVLGFDKEVDQRPNEHIVDSTALNDFEDTNLMNLIEQIAQKKGRGALRIGVVGVWTEAKVQFLMYDLKTRCHIDQLATCSALTASGSRSQHFNALEQMHSILGVSVHDSVGEFAEWMVADSSAALLGESPEQHGIKIEIADPEAQLEVEDRSLLGFLYRDSSKLQLATIAGGYSGAAVYKVTSWDALGHLQAPTVTKVGPRSLIGTERASLERVESVLGNSAPRVMGFADVGEKAGIKYSYAAMGRGMIRTFKSLYEAGISQERVDEILREVFFEILEPFYAAAQYERLPLLEHYSFHPRYADRVRKQVTEQFPAGDDATEVVLPDGSVGMNVADFYAKHVPEHLGRIGEYHYVSFVHGDMNASNILVDGRQNVSIIDFFHTSRGHILKDLIKLENDLLYILTPVEDEQSITEALKITHALLAINDLRAPLPIELPGIKSLGMLRAWATLRTLRSVGALFCREDRNPVQLMIGQLRNAMHTQMFIESDDLQKRWALAAACLTAKRIVEVSQKNRLLRIDWADSAELKLPGKLGMTICPGRKDYNRDLAEDLRVLQNENVPWLYGFMTDQELEWAGIPDINNQASKLDIIYGGLPILDQDVPSMEDAQELCSQILGQLKQGENVVLHCIGGLGRTGMIAACVAVEQGLSAKAAINIVRDARGPRAVESEAQEKFVAEYAATSRN